MAERNQKLAKVINNGLSKQSIGSNKTEKKQTVWHYQQTKAIAKQA